MTRAARARVRDAVVARSAGVSHEVLATIVDQVPAYAALSPAQLAEVAAIAEWGTGRVLDLWVEDQVLGAPDLERLRGIGAVRALDGRPLTGVLRAYRLAGSHVISLVEELGEGHLEVADAMALARLWMTSIDSMSDALTAGHEAATGRLNVDRSRALADLLDDLLLGRQVTRTGLTDRSRELGLVVDARVALVVVAQGRPEAQGGEPIDPGSLDAFLTPLVPDHDRHTLRGARQVGRTVRGVVVLPADIEVVDTAAARRGWNACWLTGLSLSELPRAHRLAQHFLDLAPARAFADRAVRGEGDAQLVALLTGQGDADPGRLVGSTLPALLADDNQHLREGLEAFLETGSATDAAALLGIHAQTMRYRLRRVHEVTGRDVRHGWDRAVLQAATLAAARHHSTG